MNVICSDQIIRMELIRLGLTPAYDTLQYKHQRPILSSFQKILSMGTKCCQLMIIKNDSIAVCTGFFISTHIYIKPCLLILQVPTLYLKVLQHIVVLVYTRYHQQCQFVYKQVRLFAELKKDIINMKILCRSNSNWYTTNKL